MPGVQQKYERSAKGRDARARTAKRHAARHAREYRARMRSLIHERKRVPCADCGGTFDPVCMDFDHRDRAQKLFDIGTIGASRGVDALIAEIAKCDVVCANCHRLRTYRGRDHARISRAVETNHERAQLPLLLEPPTTTEEN